MSERTVIFTLWFR